MKTAGEPNHTPPEAPDNNGAGSLSDRVRSLRLQDRGAAGSGPGGRSVLPWALCVILLAATAAFGYRAYRVGPSVPAQPAEEAPAKPTTAVTSTGEVASSGDVVLQA